LETEADMLEDSEHKAREALGFKRPRYQGPHKGRAQNFRIDRSMGTGGIQMRRGINLSRGQESKAEGFPPYTSNKSNSYHGDAGMPWCQKCNKRPKKL